MVASGLDVGGKAVHCRTKKENEFVWNGLHKTVKLLFGWLVCILFLFPGYSLIALLR